MKQSCAAFTCFAVLALLVPGCLREVEKQTERCYSFDSSEEAACEPRERAASRLMAEESCNNVEIVAVEEGPVADVTGFLSTRCCYLVTEVWTGPIGGGCLDLGP